VWDTEVILVVGIVPDLALTHCLRRRTNIDESISIFIIQDPKLIVESKYLRLYHLFVHSDFDAITSNRFFPFSEALHGVFHILAHGRR
jgi:hypothetical protein